MQYCLTQKVENKQFTNKILESMILPIIICINGLQHDAVAVFF
jgi:hypothetical protein